MPSPAVRPPAPASLADGPLEPASRHYPRLLYGLVRAHWLVHHRPLAALLARLAQARSACGADRLAGADLKGIAHAFERLALLATTHDQCLPRSLALAFHLAHRGYAPELVFAVRLQPFKAHCWVECDGWMVNGRLEEARHYTPILRA